MKKSQKRKKKHGEVKMIKNLLKRIKPQNETPEIHFDAEILENFK